MTGEVLVRCVPSAVWRPRLTGRGQLPVVVDGVRTTETVGRGGFVRLPLSSGNHTVRVGRRLARSNTVTVEVTDGGLERLEVLRLSSVGLAFWLAGYVVGALAIRANVLVGALLFAALEGVVLGVPGISWRLRASAGAAGQSPVSAEAAEDRWVEAQPSTAATTGLWWESDPRFAKRFGKGE